MVRRSSARRQGPKSAQLLALICSLPERIDGPASAGDEGEGSTPPPFVWPPGPQAPSSHEVQDENPHGVPGGRRHLECDGSLLEMLGYDQHGDFHVHGVAPGAC